MYRVGRSIIKQGRLVNSPDKWQDTTYRMNSTLLSSHQKRRAFEQQSNLIVGIFYQAFFVAIRKQDGILEYPK